MKKKLKNKKNQKHDPKNKQKGSPKYDDFQK